MFVFPSIDGLVFVIRSAGLSDLFLSWIDFAMLVVEPLSHMVGIFLSLSFVCVYRNCSRAFLEVSEGSSTATLWIHSLARFGYRENIRLFDFT